MSPPHSRKGLRGVNNVDRKSISFLAAKVPGTPVFLNFYF
jgi:hypothetical protein